LKEFSGIPIQYNILDGCPNGVPRGDCYHPGNHHPPERKRRTMKKRLILFVTFLTSLLLIGATSWAAGPIMSFLVRNYRLMVAYAGLWKKPGVKVYKGPPITLSMARSWATSGVRPTPLNNTSAVTYTVTVKGSAITRSDGSQTMTQTITTTGSDGSSYSDYMSHTTDTSGTVTETQTVTATDADGTISETATSTSTSTSSDDTGIIGGDPNWCWGILCDKYWKCCSFCPKETGCSDITVNFY
jgi:hypothetical protein